MVTQKGTSAQSHESTQPISQLEIRSRQDSASMDSTRSQLRTSPALGAGVGCSGNGVRLMVRLMGVEGGR